MAMTLPPNIMAMLTQALPGQAGQSAWQAGLAQAEAQRNYQNAVRNATPTVQIDSSGNPLDIASGALGAMPTSLPGPAAYGLAGFNSGMQFDSTEAAQAALARIKQFDPNASITGSYTGYGDGGGQYGSVLNFDQSKLPAQAIPGSVNVGMYGRDRLFNNNLVYNDPNYGAVSAPANVKYQTSTWLDTVGPMLVGAFGGALGGSSLLSSLLSKAPQIGNMASNLFGGGSPFLGGGSSTISPQQMLMLRLLAARNQAGGG